jgi:hypothetical protein
MTDRECMIAVFKGVAALYAKLTGEPLSLSVDTAQGVIQITDRGGLHARLEEERGLSGVHLGRNSMPAASPTLPGAT